jgi:hypothetical protein
MWRMEIKGTPAITGIPLFISNEFMTILMRLISALHNSPPQRKSLNRLHQ